MYNSCKDSRTTWTNNSEEKPDLVVDQDQQYKIPLKTEGKTDRTAKGYKRICPRFRLVKTRLHQGLEKLSENRLNGFSIKNEINLKIKYDWCKPANLPGFPGSLQASSNLPVSRLEHQIYSPWETTTVAFSKILSLISLFWRCQKGK